MRFGASGIDAPRRYAPPGSFRVPDRFAWWPGSGAVPETRPIRVTDRRAAAAAGRFTMVARG